MSAIAAGASSTVLATAPRVTMCGIGATPEMTLVSFPGAEEVDEYYATLAETWLGVPAGDLLPGSTNPFRGTRICSFRENTA